MRVATLVASPSTGCRIITGCARFHLSLCLFAEQTECELPLLSLIACNDNGTNPMRAVTLNFFASTDRGTGLMRVVTLHLPVRTKCRVVVGGVAFR